MENCYDTALYTNYKKTNCYLFHYQLSTIPLLTINHSTINYN